MTGAQNLNALLKQPRAIVSPGAWDCLSALLIEKAGFETISISGAAVTAGHLGLPDKSFLGLTDMLQLTSSILSAVDIPVLVDCEDGFGNALHVIRTVKEMARLGAACVCFQDKDPRHPQKDVIVSCQKMQKKLEAALMARGNSDMLIMARTDALTSCGIDEAIARARRYAQTGADLIFINGIETDEQISAIQAAQIDVPLKFNNTIKKGERQRTSQELYQKGFKLVAYSSSLQKAAIKSMVDILEELRIKDKTEGFIDRKISQKQRAQLLNQSLWEEYQNKYV